MLQMPRINAARGELAIEKSPSYFVTESAPARVRNMSAKAKLLLVVRWVGQFIKLRSFKLYFLL